MVKPRTITQAELEAILLRSKVLREEDTGFCGAIRIIDPGGEGGEILVQEQSDKGEILLRSFTVRSQAESFVDKRLEHYDRMWDGCGCRIDYHE